MRMSTSPPPPPLPAWQISGYDPILFSVQVGGRAPITDKRVTISRANQVAVPPMQALREEQFTEITRCAAEGRGGGRGVRRQAALPGSAHAPTCVGYLHG